MKICCIWRSTGAGNRLFFNLYSQLAGSGAEVHVITNDVPLPGSANVDRLITHRLGGQLHREGFSFAGDLCFFTSAIYLFFQLHRRSRFDFIYMEGRNFPAVGLLLSILATISGCRSTMGFSSFPLRKEDLKNLPQLMKPFPRWCRMLYRLAFWLPAKLWSWGVDAITVPSQIGRSLLRDIGVAETKLFLIPPGVDFTVFKPYKGIRQPPYRIVYASSCYPWKGTLDLLEAFEIALNSGLALKLTYIFYTSRSESKSMGNLISQLEQEIAARRLTQQVEIHDGPFEGIAQYIAQADIVACPLQTAVWTLDIPMSVLEGMACALPVLGTRIGGIPEAVKHGVNGYLVEPSSRHELAGALIRMVKDPAGMKRLGEESYRLAQQFDLRTGASLLQKMYLSLAHEGEPHG
jgi:glycosyltransferase involved in cell wall biosynthesis